MNKLLLGIALMGALAPSVGWAQDEPVVIEDAVPIPGTPNPQMASVSPFIVGLKEPQGLALDNNGDIIVCDYGAGEVLRFGATGEKKAVLASGLKGPSQIAEMRVTMDPGRLDKRDGKAIPYPSWMVSERKANRVISLRLIDLNNLSSYHAKPLGNEIVEPMGLLQPPSKFVSSTNPFGSVAARQGLFGQLPQGTYAVAHTTSKIYRLDNGAWKLVYTAPDEDGDAGRYGLRCLANDGSTLFVSDEVNGDVLMMSQNGRMAKFASGFADPSGMEVRGDWLYVCDEGDGGRLWKVDKSGVKTLVAQGLGRPRNVLFTDDKSALVSDRDGRVLKLNWRD